MLPDSKVIRKKGSNNNLFGTLPDGPLYQAGDSCTLKRGPGPPAERTSRESRQSPPIAQFFPPVADPGEQQKVLKMNLIKVSICAIPIT